MPTIEQEFFQSRQAAADFGTPKKNNTNAGQTMPKAPKYATSKEAYYDRDSDTVFAPDNTGEFYHHEMFHARPDANLLNSLRPYYEGLNDERLSEMGADLDFVKRIEGDPGHFYSPEEIGARIAAASMMLKNAGVNSIDENFLNEARKNDTMYGDNFRDLLHMYNNKNLVDIFNIAKYGK